MQEFIEKKKTSSNKTTYSDVSGESLDVPCVETTKISVPGESPDVPLVETSKKSGTGESPDVQSRVNHWQTNTIVLMFAFDVAAKDNDW